MFVGAAQDKSIATPSYNVLCIAVFADISDNSVNDIPFVTEARIVSKACRFINCQCVCYALRRADLWCVSSAVNGYCVRSPVSCKL